MKFSRRRHNLCKLDPELDHLGFRESQGNTASVFFMGTTRVIAGFIGVMGILTKSS